MEEECRRKRQTLQRYSRDHSEIAEVPAIVYEVLRSPGRPLDNETRAFFEPRFSHDFSRVRTYSHEAVPVQAPLAVGAPRDEFEQEADTVAQRALSRSVAPGDARADFSAVRIHTDTRAAESTQAIDANAYTVGQHVVFGAGMYTPQTLAGQRLLAHELTHVVQQETTTRPSERPAIYRQPKPQPASKEGIAAAADDCHIRNPRAYIYFELARRFYDPTDSNPEVLKRARCVKKAFSLLTAEDAVEFSQQLMGKWGIYSDYMTLHRVTRLAIAEILAEVLGRKDTNTYMARLLFLKAANLAEKKDGPTVIVQKAGPQLLKITLDKPVVAMASAELLGASECDQYWFGFTQFEKEEHLIADYFDSKSQKHLVIDWDPETKPYLPCYDVFHDGDVWSYSKQLECHTGQAKKQFDADFLQFQDTPSEGMFLFADMPTLFPTGIEWTDKFITIFAVMLPNGVVKPLSWFEWRLDYCENFPPTEEGKKSIAKSQGPLKGRRVTVSPVTTGAPPSPFATMLGKPAPKACNTLVKRRKTPDPFAIDSALIRCGNS